MSEHYRAVSMAFALVDEKIGDVRATLPRPTEQIDQIDSFLDSYSDRVDPSAGGSIANVISTYSGIALGGRAKLFYSIGNDDRGKLFRSETEHLVGGPQIDSTKATGTCIFIISETGEPLDEITFYGAAESVELPKDEVSQDSYDIFVSNVNTFRVANDRSHDLLRAARRTNGIFVLRLSVDVSQKELQKLHSAQIKALESIDEKIKKLVQFLPAPLLIIITADHGECFGEGMNWGHGYPLAKVMEVPILISTLS